MDTENIRLLGKTRSDRRTFKVTPFDPLTDFQPKVFAILGARLFPFSDDHDIISGGG
jgi:hypothetical protein